MLSGSTRWGSWWWSVITVALLTAVLATGCGTDTESTGAEEGGKPDSYAVAHGETIEDCLIEVGVQFATDPHDIAFFEDARKGADVGEGGFAYDAIDKVDVRLLVSKREGAKRWMLWYSRPPSSSLGPEYVAHHLGSPAETASSAPVFVAFKVKPKFSFRKEIRRCVRFPLTLS